MLLRHLFEGGWATEVTQSTKLTPRNVKRALALLPRLEKDFNAYLAKHHLPPVVISKPVGSTSYVERDLKANPDKEYGDIDVLMEIPRLEDQTEARTTTIYKNALNDFTQHAKVDYIYPRDVKASNVIVKIGPDEHVQVDMVMTPQDVAHWAAARMTPEHGLKGAVTGFLYSALAEVLHLSISQSGVLAKRKAGQVVPFVDRSGDKVERLSTDFANFGRHIAEWVVKELNPTSRVKLHPSLEEQPGLKADDVKLADMVKMVKGIVRTIELNDALGRGFLKKHETAVQLMNAIREVYREKLLSAAKDAKLDKAQTPEAKQRAADLRQLFITKAAEVSNALKL